MRRVELAGVGSSPPTSTTRASTNRASTSRTSSSTPAAPAPAILPVQALLAYTFRMRCWDLSLLVPLESGFGVCVSEAQLALRVIATHCNLPAFAQDHRVPPAPPSPHAFYVKKRTPTPHAAAHKHKHIKSKHIRAEAYLPHATSTTYLPHATSTTRSSRRSEFVPTCHLGRGTRAGAVA